MEVSFTNWFSDRWPPRTPSEKTTGIMGYGIRPARVGKGQNHHAFTIAFAEYDDVIKEVVFRKNGVGVIDQINMNDGGRIELWQNGRLVGGWASTALRADDWRQYWTWILLPGALVTGRRLGPTSSVTS